MSAVKGNTKQHEPATVTLACGHAVLYAPPQPNASDEITCGVCAEPTEVVASPRRWTA